MKVKRFTEEQIIRVLKEAESGLKVTDLCRQQGISEATYYRWKSKHGGLEVSEAKRLRALEEKNRRLKQLVADKELDILGLRTALSKSTDASPSATSEGGGGRHENGGSKRMGGLFPRGHRARDVPVPG